jgi:hypothetical protein
MKLRYAATGATVALLLCVVAPQLSAGAASPTPGLPQNEAAQAAATWLARQVSPSGFVPAGQTPNLSDTAQTVLALASANVDPAAVQAALGYLAANLQSYVAPGGTDEPGSLALLILDIVATGGDPHNFGQSDLVSRLLSTQQSSGPDAGLFGTEAQLGAYTAGTYQQGLALTALAAAGIRGTGEVPSAVSWLVGQQCPDGGWTLPDQALNSCAGLPAAFEGPDTNSTALAVEGLAAQGALTGPVTNGARGFLSAAQDADAGWSYFPNTVATPGVTDPDSTSLVLQGLAALGVSPTDPSFQKGANSPVATLLSFQLSSGADAGALDFSSPPQSPNLIATYQAVPALAGVTFPFVGGSYWLAGADGGVYAFGNAGQFGSLPGVGVVVDDVVGLVPTADSRGYWLDARDGGTFAFGDAGYFGSLPGDGVQVTNIVGMIATVGGRGYWMVGSDGGVFAFGDAGYLGSLPGDGVQVSDIVGIVATPDNRGYWLLGSDGGVFAFGDAGYAGSVPGAGVHVSNVVAMARTPDGHGYWIAGADGGLYAFGDAPYLGAPAASGPPASPVVGLAASATGLGYDAVGANGSVWNFGNALFAGSLPDLGVSVGNVVAVATPPPTPS